ncbi:MAG: hypothetical protein IT303_00855 [Dehalococcoidia bacterium]|nr:hypothetical protein [Dehalococcoidia bacterium]
MVVTKEPQDFVYERTLELHGNEPAKVLVRLGVAREDSVNPGLWLCPFQIVGIGDGDVHLVSGVDGIDALFTALGTIAVHLRAAQRRHNLTWCGMADVGFPIIFGPRSDRDFLQRTDAAEDDDGS